MYVQVGANCNICEINPGMHGQIRRYNADGTGMEIVARGVRNTVGFDWHPVTKELWFTDNGRDWAGNAGPEDELNRIAKGQEGANFGFPYCHADGHCRSRHQAPEPVRRRRDAGCADSGRTPACSASSSTPARCSRRPIRTSRSSRGTGRGTARPEVRLRRRDGPHPAERHRQDRAVHDRAARRRQERVLRPARLCVPDAGRLAAGLGRVQRRDLSHLVTAHRGKQRGSDRLAHV